MALMSACELLRGFVETERWAPEQMPQATRVNREGPHRQLKHAGWVMSSCLNSTIYLLYFTYNDSILSPVTTQHHPTDAVKDVRPKNRSNMSDIRMKVTKC